MGKPRMIILIRHAQSEGNKNREIHQSVPDHRVKLTPEGHKQAQEAGSRLRELLRPDDTLHIFTSPYRRTRETTEGLLDSLTSDTPSPSPFPRHTIKVYEEPRLREQDFGNFQPCSAEMERMWLERADYGHFFYRIPNGESAADAYDRVSGFNESLWRLFGEKDSASVCVLVTHGLMTRVFLMKWYHWSVEYFEDLRNINHCEFVIMKLDADNGKYQLQNNLRTWSELKREREQDRQRKGISLPVTDHVPVRRRWGGCPDGCNHGIRKTSTHTVPGPPASTSTPTPTSTSTSTSTSTPNTSTNNPSSNSKKPTLPNLAQLHLGRDGGGSMSGMDSLAASEEEREEAGPIPPHAHTHAPAPAHAPGTKPSKPSKLSGRVSGPRTSLSQHQTRPSQDLGNDGDDESPALARGGSTAKDTKDVKDKDGKDGKDGQSKDGQGQGQSRLRRARSYHHHHHHHHHYHHGNNKNNKDNNSNNNNNNAKLSSTRVGDILGDQGRDTDTESVYQKQSFPEQEPTPDQVQAQEQEQEQEREQEQKQELDVEEVEVDVDVEAEKQKDQSIRESVY